MRLDRVRELQLRRPSVLRVGRGAQDELSDVQCVLPQQIAAQVRRDEKERREAWQAWWAREWGMRPGAVYRWVRDDAFAPPPPGRVIGAAGRQRNGERPPNGRAIALGLGPCQPQVCGGPKAVPGGLHGQSRGPFAQNPHAGLPDDGGWGLVCKRPQAMSPSFMGLNGWGLQDLRSLLERALHWLGQLRQLVEEVGQWPGVLAEGYTSIIPKPGEVGPLGTRPLIVLSMVYRLWAGTRLRDVLLWQEAWAHQGLWLPPLPGSQRRGRVHRRPCGAGAAQGVEYGRPQFGLCQML